MHAQFWSGSMTVDPDVGGRIILKWIWKGMGGCGLDSFVLAFGPKAD
jgi:hypothetical protein